MDKWEDVKGLNAGDEARVATKDGHVHGVVFEKDDATRAITFINAAGEKVQVAFE
jgi:hypothetical protein